jgi:hypothetical protein
MSRTKKKSDKSPGPCEAAKDSCPFSEHIQKLEDLRQPWNPVVRSAIDLLRRERSNDYCEVVTQQYGYAEPVQQNGMWLCSKLSNHARRNAICIVLDGRVEVIGRQSLPTKEGKCSISPAQPRHMISMEKGEILGAYEFTGNLFQHPETHEYEVLSGPVCIQFDHDLFNSFVQNTTTSRSSQNLATCATGLTESQAISFRDWWVKGENHHLIKAFSDANSIETPHSDLLFINLKFPYLENPEDQYAWEAFRNAVVETAWRQSRASRGRDFKASSVAPADCPDAKDLKGIEIEAYKATLVHLDEVINGVGTLWTEPWNAARFPAIVSFLQNIELARLEIAAAHVFIKEPLHFLPKEKNGRLSVVDFISRYSRVETVGKSQGNQIKRESLTAWRLDDPLANESGQRTLEALKRHFDAWTQTLQERNPQVLSTIIPKPPTKSSNPFQRFWIEVNSGLDTLPAIEWIESKTGTAPDLGGTLIVTCQHFLRETCAWFAHLMSKGATIIAIGKDYSTCPEVARRLQRIGVTIVESPAWTWRPGEYGAHLEDKARMAWAEASNVIAERAFNEVIVIDDGGVLHKTAGELFDKDRNNVSKWCGVEQTTSGEVHAKQAPYPVALVSRHEEKRKWESRIIADKIFENSLRMCAPLSGKDKRIGIIGAGAIAEAVAERYSKDSYLVFWFSESGSIANKSIYKKQTLNELLDEADVIFGCAGHDVLKALLTEVDGQNLVARKWFISCSSSDTEFASLLKSYDKGKPLCTPLRLHNPFSTMVVQTKPAPCFVLNGGFPINFDRERDSVPLHLIQFTRALMHWGLIKARGIARTGELDTGDAPWEELRQKLGGSLVPAP